MVQMLGWFSAEAACASRWKRASACGSLATSSGRNLRATKRWRRSVLGLVDDTHPAAAELLDDAVVRDGLADHSIGSRACWERMLVGSRGQVNQKLRTSEARAPARPWLLKSLQLRVLRLGFLQDGDVGVGVFPEGEEIFVGGERPDAGGIGIRALRGFRLQCLSASHAQMRQRSRPTVPHDAAVVDDLLKLVGGSTALSGRQGVPRREYRLDTSRRR